MNKYFNILSFLILFVMGFLFLHSELDLFSPENHAHNTHDFCDIVDNAKTENPDFSKIKTYCIDISAVFLSLPADLTPETLTITIYNPNKPQTDVDINILHRTFLI